ncbi:MAG: PP2C family serine/threonine-protein phosphatase [Waterburya sp.]
MTWKAIARSAKGTSHQKQNMRCQDYSHYKIIDHTIIGVVADGAGSAKYSDIGAELAVNTVLKTFTEQDISDITELFTVESSVSETENSVVLARKPCTVIPNRQHRLTNATYHHLFFIPPYYDDSIEIMEINCNDYNLSERINKKSTATVTIVQSTNEQKAEQFFSKIVEQVIAALKAKAEEKNCLIGDLACTLLIIIATSGGLAAMQIGDGFITVRYSESVPQVPQLLFPPDKGEYINETTFVTSANALTDMQVVIQPKQPEFICASTDGLERLAIQMSNWTPFAPFFDPLERCLRETKTLEESDEYLTSFLDSERLNARTDDDKTLFLCIYDQSNSGQ